MKKRSSLVFLISGCLLLVSCSSFRGQFIRGDLEQGDRDPQAQIIEALLEKNARGEGAATYPQFQEFQKKNPGSPYLYAARFGEAWSLEQMDQPTEALSIYNSIISVGKKSWPKLYARTVYRSSFVYESLGDDVRVIAALTEAEKLSEDLPPEIAWAENPSRLAQVYAKINRIVESDRYLRSTEVGLQKLLSQSRPSTEWLAKIYLQMGRLNVSQSSSENIEFYLKSQKFVQRYLLNAIAQNDPTWSEQAVKTLIDNYNFFFSRIENHRREENANTFDQREIEKQQFQLLGEYLRMLNEALMLKPLVEQRMNPFQVKTFSFLEKVEQKSYDYLYSQFDRMSLTDESLKLNDLRRPGKVIVNDLFPNETH